MGYLAFSLLSLTVLLNAKLLEKSTLLKLILFICLIVIIISLKFYYKQRKLCYNETKEKEAWQELI